MIKKFQGKKGHFAPEKRALAKTWGGGGLPPHSPHVPTPLWTDAFEQAFLRLKHLLCYAHILAYPDFSQAFILQTDASDYGVGAVLSQLDNLGNEKVIAYASKALSPREQKYSTTEKEAFAVVFGTAHFRVYLLGRHFKLITDHSALITLAAHYGS